MVAAADEATNRSIGGHEQYVPHARQLAGQLDPSSIRVPQAALAPLDPVRAELGRPRASSAFLADLEARLAGTATPDRWRWTFPHGSYYSPQAMVALLDAEQVPWWRERVAAVLCVAVADVDATLAHAQQHWDLTRWADQIFDAEFSAYAPASRWRAQTRHRRHDLGPLEDRIVYVPGAVGHAVQRKETREVMAGHDGPGQWGWLLPEAIREALARKAATSPVQSLRRGVAEAARLLGGRPPRRWTQLTTVAELVGGLEASRASCLRDVGCLQRRLEITPLWRPGVRHALHQAIESRLDADRAPLEQLGQLTETLRALKHIQQERRAWEHHHVEVLVRGEIYAEQLQALERHALLALERDPPPYLLRALGRSFPYASVRQRGYWLAAAREIEHCRADLGITDRHDPLGPTPKSATSRVRHTETVQVVDELRAHIERPELPAVGGALHRMIEPPSTAVEVDGP